LRPGIQPILIRPRMRQPLKVEAGVLLDQGGGRVGAHSVLRPRPKAFHSLSAFHRRRFCTRFLPGR
jgi:hypothetical protein